jgi:hypothetical protein
MANFKRLLDELKRERDLVRQQFEAINAAVGAFAGVYTGQNGKAPRTMSAAGRKRIAAAQRARWAKVKGTKGAVAGPKPTRTLSAAARKKIAAAQRARWAKVKAQKKTA